MTTKRPAEARREESPGGLPKRTPRDRLDLVPRLQVIVDELRLLDADDVDVPLTLAEGLLEDIEAVT